MKSILRVRILCSLLLILLSLGVILGYGIWRWDIFGSDRAYDIYDVRAYASPEDSRVLEVRRWKDQNSDLGWDFCLVSNDGEEQLLERTHALAGAAITSVNWTENGVDVSTKAPSGTFTLTWN